MEQYIPKSALVAEIENLLKPVKQRLERDKNDPWDSDIAIYKFGIQLIKNIDTLEVKEVDLEKELDSFAYSLPHSATGDGYHLGHFDDPRVIEARDSGWTHSWKYKEVEKIAKHFFELGMAASNK